MLRPALAVLACLFSVTATAQTVQHPFTFTRVPAELPAMRNALAAWGDYDGDGDLDLFTAGEVRVSVEGAYELQAHLYRHDDPVVDPSVPGQQRPQLTDRSAGLVPMAYGDAAWGDYDGDGDLDLVALGSTTAAPPYAPRTILYRNDAGTLTPSDAGLRDLHSGTVAWADHDGDGDLDLLLTGTAATEAPYAPETRLYLNSGGTFAEAATTLPPLAFGSVVWQDLQGDARPDVYLSGLTPAGIVTHTYEQRGGQYVLILEEPGTLFSRAAVATQQGSAAQRALTGAVPSRTYFTGVTRLSSGGAVTNVFGGGVDYGDLDGDGDLDLVVTGRARQFAPTEARVYQMEGGALVEKNLLLGSSSGPLTLLDYDGDGDLDLFTAGTTTALYRNDRSPLGGPPAAPSGLVARVHAGGVTLAWEPSTAPTATYEVWVGTAPDRFDVVSPPALLASGLRTLPLAGRAGARESVSLTLPEGTYHWGVQQVSAERNGSPFAMGTPFTLVTTGTDGDALPTAYGLDAPTPSPFQSEAHLRYHLPAAGPATLAVYDLAGRRVRTLVDAPQPAGTHSVRWDGRDDAGHLLASGVYLCRFTARSYTSTRTLLFVR